jgi:hypothetical protein
MANEEHVAILKQGMAAWNAWRDENPNIRPDLSEANLHDRDLRYANLSNACLIDTDLSEALLSHANFIGAECSSETDFSKARLVYADFSEVNLNGVRFIEANLHGAILKGALFIEANFYAANLLRVVLTGADLSGANLQAARLMNADLAGTNLTGCRVQGISAWRVELDNKTKQEGLIVTGVNEPAITVDNMEVAQFIDHMLNNQKVRNAIDTITSKVVLILGRFTDQRKVVLDALREQLRERNYVPILFDFEVPDTRDIEETVLLLAGMARFVVADITDAKSIPQELGVIVPNLPSVPVQPLLLEGSDEYAMFEHFKRYPWVLEIYRYPSSERLIADLGERVVDPAENYARSVRGAAAGRTG